MVLEQLTSGEVISSVMVVVITIVSGLIFAATIFFPKR